MKKEQDKFHLKGDFFEYDGVKPYTTDKYTISLYKLAHKLQVLCTIHWCLVLAGIVGAIIASQFVGLVVSLILALSIVLNFLATAIYAIRSEDKFRDAREAFEETKEFKKQQKDYFTKLIKEKQARLDKEAKDLVDVYDALTTDNISEQEKISRIAKVLEGRKRW